MAHETREGWLDAATEALRPVFDEAMHPITAKVRVSMGFPSHRALSMKNRAVGECWSANASKDGTMEVFVSPVLDDPMEVLATLAHELTHTIAGTKVGHKGPFARIVRAIGLEGKPTHTVAGSVFKMRVSDILETLGPLPHGRITARNPDRPPQKTRQLKCECETCGYIARVAKKWIVESGAPMCPTDKRPMICDDVDPEEGEEG